MVQVVLIFQLHALIIKEHKLNAMLSKDSMELKFVVIQQEQDQQRIASLKHVIMQIQELQLLLPLIVLAGY